MSRYVLGAVLALAGLAIAACSEKPKTPGPADLALVTEALEAQLNTPAALLQRNMKDANRTGRIYVEQLVVPLDSGVVPVDWWVYRNGWIKLAGVDSYSRGYFALTPAGQAFVNGPTPRWLKASFKAPPAVSCSSGGSFTGCQVSGTASVSQAPEAAALFRFKGAPDIAFNAELDDNFNRWQAETVQPKGKAPAEIERLAAFGGWPQLYKARNHFAEVVDRQLR